MVKKIPGWLSVNEGFFLKKAVKITKNLKGEVVEIGSYHGKSTIWLAQEVKRVFAIDPHEGLLTSQKDKGRPSYRSFLANLKKAGVLKRVVSIVKTSAEVARDWNKGIKVLFIDGLHDEKSASQDFKLWGKHLVNGGIIALHDAFCGWVGPEKVALKQIVFSNRYCEVGVVGSIIYGIKGRANLLLRIDKLRHQFFISQALKLNRVKIIPRLVKFFLIHRVVKLLLVNRFTLRRD